MKKLVNLRRHPAALPLCCYALALAAWLALGVYALAADSLAKAQGNLREQTLAATDFQLVDLTLLDTAVDIESGETVQTLQTTSGDPQMILEDVSAQTVRTLQIWADYDGEAREMCLYYTRRADAPYSQDDRVFPVLQSDGSYLYTLPRGTLYALRLDPCSPDENATVYMTVQRIVLNGHNGLARYFVPSWYQLFCLVLYPALAAAALALALDSYRLVRGR